MRRTLFIARDISVALGRLALAGALMLISGQAAAQGAAAPPVEARAAGAETPTPDAAAAPQHRLAVYSFGGAMFYLSTARTIGGGGGGLGIRDTVQDRFIFQADVSYLTLIGNTGAVRLGAGLQRSGVYTPAILLTLSTLFGDQFSFLTPDHPTAVTRPTLALGVDIAPLRFTAGTTQLSLFEFGVGVGTDLPGLAVQYHLNVLEIGTSF